MLCICTANPPNCINLDMVRAFCWFATKDVCEMDNSNKQNMLYWWYMTKNIYNIGGRGVTKELLMYLMERIGKARGTGGGGSAAQQRQRKQDHDFVGEEKVMLTLCKHCFSGHQHQVISAQLPLFQR